MFSWREYDDFNKSIGDSILDKAIEWIQKHVRPEDLFAENDLLAWAKEKQPEDIFSEAELRGWAEDNGMVVEATHD